MLGCAVVTAIAIISVIQHKSGSVSPGLVGLAISYALGVTGNLQQILSFVIVWAAHHMVSRISNPEFWIYKKFLTNQNKSYLFWRKVGKSRLVLHDRQKKNHESSGFCIHEIIWWNQSEKLRNSRNLRKNYLHSLNLNLDWHDNYSFFNLF